MPGIVRPLVAILLAAAIAVGGVLVARGIAPASDSARPELVTAEVATAVPAEELPLTASDLTTELADGWVRPAPATEQVRVGFDDAATSAALERAIDDVSVATDPLVEVPGVLVRSSLEGPADPCAVPGSRPDDCPEGIPGTVLGARPALAISGAGIASSARGGIGADCSGFDGGTMVVVQITKPATIRLDYAAAGSPSGSITWQTDAAARASWEGEFVGRAATDPWPVITACLLLDLPAGEIYNASAFAFTPDGESATRRFAFNTDGTPTRPVARVIALTDDIVVVTVHYQPGQSTTVRPIVYDPATSVDCSVSSRLPVLQLGATRESDVSAAELLGRNEIPTYTKRATWAFAAPEGITMLVCIEATEPGGEKYSATAVVRTADRAVPVVSLYSASVSLDEGKRVTVQGYLGNGAECGTWQSAPTTERVVFGTPGRQMCDYSGLASAGASVAGAVPTSTGILGRYTLTLDDNLADDAATAFTIDLGSLSYCWAHCELPADSFFPLTWRYDDDYVTVIARVSWTHGNTNGALATTVSDFADTTARPMTVRLLDSRAATLRLDDFNDEPSVRYGVASVRVSSSQPGTYTARLVAAPGSGLLCSRVPAVLERSGELGAFDGAWTVPVDVRFEGLCAGAEYQVAIILTDGEGRTSTWGVDPATLGAPDDAWFGGDWSGSRLRIAPLATPIGIGWTIYNDSPGVDYGPMMLTIAFDGVTAVRVPVCPAPGAVLEDIMVQRVVTVGENVHVTGSLVPVRSCGSTIATLAAPVSFASDVNIEQLHHRGARLDVTTLPTALVGSRTRLTLEFLYGE